MIRRWPLRIRHQHAARSRSDAGVLASLDDICHGPRRPADLHPVRPGTGQRGRGSRTRLASRSDRMASTVCSTLRQVVSSHRPIRSVSSLSTACSPATDHRPACTRCGLVLVPAARLPPRLGPRTPGGTRAPGPGRESPPRWGPMITPSTTTSNPAPRKTSATARAPENRSASCRSASAPASGRISTRPLTIIARRASPGTQTPCWNRSASNLATVDLPAADTPEITNSATPPIVSSAHAHVVRIPPEPSSEPCRRSAGGQVVAHQPP